MLANILKVVLPSLVGKEQAGFLHGRLVADYIIAIQEVVHSLD